MLEVLANIAGILGGVAIIVGFIMWLWRVGRRRGIMNQLRSLFDRRKVTIPEIRVNVSRQPWVSIQEAAGVTLDALYSGRRNISPACTVVIPKLSSLEQQLRRLDKQRLTEDQKRLRLNLHDNISSLKERQEFMQRGLDILLKPDVIRILDVYLSLDGWRDFITGFFHLIEMGCHVDPGIKIDVWRTQPPKLSAPIRVTDEEMAEILRRCGISNSMHLTMGPGNFDATQLPPLTQICKSLPRILYEITSYHDKIDPKIIPNLFFLAEWNIGLG